MKKDTIILYANQYTALQWLSYEDMGFLFHQIFRWMNDIKMDTETEWSQALFLAFNFMTLQISIDNEKYLQKKERVDKWKQRKQGKKEEEKQEASSRVRVDEDEDKDVDVDVDVDEDVDVDVSINRNQDAKQKENENVEKLVEYWNKAIDMSDTRLKKVRLITEERRAKLLKIVRTISGADAAKAIFNAMNSPFCNGATKARSRPVDFDWLIRYENFTKLLEGTL